MEASPLAESHYVEDHEEEDTTFGCWCFHGVCWRKSNSGSKRYLLGEDKDGWFAEKVKKMKEISEVLVGPKRKNFIRRFNMHGFNKNDRKMQYQYDFQSYALNFDDGIDKEVDLVFPNFSARYGASAGMSNQLIEY